MEIKENQETEQENSGFLFLTVSVFLVILCFFILMNSLSTHNQQKAQDVAKAVSYEFTGKDLKQKIKMFEKRKYEVETGQKTSTFKEVLAGFVDSQQGNASASLSESKSNYSINVRLNNAFGPDNSVVRPPAEKFIRALNHYILTNRKQPDSVGKLVIFLNPADEKLTSLTKQRIKSLHASLDYESKRALSFSFAEAEVASTDELLNNIYILFEKNEF